MKTEEVSCAFWQDQLRGVSRTLTLPFDHRRPPVPSFIKSSLSIVLEENLCERLETNLCRTGRSPSIALLAAYQALVYRYSGQDDLLVGFLNCQRHASASENGRAPRSTLLAVRTSIEDDLSGTALIERTANTVAEASKYASLPFDRISEIAAQGTTGTTDAVFNTTFIAADNADDNLATHRADFEEYLVQCDLVFTVERKGEQLILDCEFESELFEEDTIARLLSHYRVLLDRMSSHPETQVSHLPLLTDDERRQLLLDDVTNEFPVETCLHELLEDQAARSPEAVAVVYEDEQLTYRELNKRANRVAHRLRDLGVGPDVLVGLCLERSSELVIALLACLKAGGAYLPIDLSYPADRLKFIMDDAQAPVLLTQTSLQSRLPETNAVVLYVDQILAESHEDHDANLEPVTDPDNLAYVIYTSGTTGNPKGSLVTHRNVLRLFAGTDDWFHFNKNDVWTLFHSCAFDFSVWELWGALLYGGRVVVVPHLVSRSPEAFYELLAKHHVTVLNQTPSAFRQLIQAEETVGQKDLALRYVIFGGEALEMQSLKPWFDRHGDQTPQLINMYGITETTVHVTYRLLSQADLGPASVIGVPIPDLQVYILDPHQQPVPIGVAGEMYVGGAGVCRGYLNREELTKERFIPDPFGVKRGDRFYRTGDLARWLPNGDIEYLGRIDHQVKIRGFRIELGEIESVLCEHPAVREATVLAREDNPGDKRLAAYLICDQPQPGTSQLRDHLKRKLPEYMVPAAFMYLDKLPLTNNGKVDRKALPAPDAERPDLDDNYLAPRTPVEQTLSAIWAKVLRIERVGVHDNYFELGGDSILSTQIVSLARGEGLTLTPKQLFERQTIGELADVVVREEQTEEAEQGLVTGEMPLTPVQHWFFEQELEDAHHYNQAFMFTVKEALNEDALRQALTALQRQHDALRLRFHREESGWRQRFAAPCSEQELPYQQIDLTEVAGDECASAINEVATTSQASLDIEQGPLWRAVYLRLGQQECGRLLLVVHHLAVDGVSWRILLEDLEKGYRQALDGKGIALGSKSTSFRSWAEQLSQASGDEKLAAELPYWEGVLKERHEPLPADFRGTANTEASARTITVRLNEQETRDLLKLVPQAYNTQINDVLLTALAGSFEQSTGHRDLFVNLEGHGREDIFENTDVSRTVGWFTTIYPVRLGLPKSTDPGQALKAVKEQLRSVPGRGLGYGVLHYLTSDHSLAHGEDPEVVFNYLGQFDSVVSESNLFDFASESAGPWHSPRQRRRQLLEINSMVVEGQLELQWIYSDQRHQGETITQLADNYINSLRELIDHCKSSDAGGYTPSDFPLCGLDQKQLDQVVGNRGDIQDIYPVSPMQLLFFAHAAGDTKAALDHWECTFQGDLKLEALQQSWDDVIRHHSILRSSFRGEGLRRPLQLVHRQIQPTWQIEDWRQFSEEEKEQRWENLLRKDRDQGMPLGQPPLMRFTLVRVDDDTHRFLWSASAMLMDGWSWPLVFRDLSKAYEARCIQQKVVLQKSRPYRDYLAWLQQHDASAIQPFWQEKLAGLTASTPLPCADGAVADDGDPFSRQSCVLPRETTDGLQQLARENRVTVNALVQSAWAVVLSRLSQSRDVVFGSAFSGRPTALVDVESMVGPFTNNIPVRVRLHDGQTLQQLLAALHADLLELNANQFVPLAEIQSWSDVPWHYRLFDSLVVLQNYGVDESARRLGTGVAIHDFEGPIHTNFPLLVLIEPGDDWRISIIFDQRKLSKAAVEQWHHDLIRVLNCFESDPAATIDDVLAQLSEPAEQSVTAKSRFTVQSQNYVPPQTEMECAIAQVWERVMKLDRIGIEENIFDLGAHSLLMLRLHQELQDALDREMSLVTLFQYPTIRLLAQHLSCNGHAADRATDVRKRAQRQRKVLGQLRRRIRS